MPGQDPCNLLPAWEAATQFLEANSHRAASVAEIYKIWLEPPFGIKEGLLPILAVAFALSNSHNLAFYRQGVFQVRMTDLDTDYLAKDPEDFQLRWMDMSNVSRGLLSDMADIVRDMDPQTTLPNLEPIDVARGLVADLRPTAALGRADPAPVEEGEARPTPVQTGEGPEQIDLRRHPTRTE